MEAGTRFNLRKRRNQNNAAIAGRTATPAPIPMPASSAVLKSDELSKGGTAVVESGVAEPVAVPLEAVVGT